MGSAREKRKGGIPTSDPNIGLSRTIESILNENHKHWCMNGTRTSFSA